jgi:hypothetical protein
MLVADAYRPDQWHDFFITVGGAAAAVTGLVFVALSLNLEVVTRDATHRYRAIGTLMNFAGIFVLCALALMGGQNHVAIGAEWLIVSSSFCGVFVHGFLRARSDGGTQTTPSLLRTMVGTTLPTSPGVFACDRAEFQNRQRIEPGVSSAVPTAVAVRALTS